MRAYSAIQCDSQATAQVRNAHRALCGGCFPRAQAKELWRGWMEPGCRSRVRTGEHRARAGMCLRTPRTAFCPVGPAWRCPQNDARRDLGGRARGAATAVGAAVEMRHRQAVRAARMPRPEGAQSESDREGSREATAPVSFLSLKGGVGSKTTGKKHGESYNRPRLGIHLYRLGLPRYTLFRFYCATITPLNRER